MSAHDDRQSVSVQDLAEWRKTNIDHHLLDVREPHETCLAAIEGAQSIPMKQVPARLADIPSNAPLVVMCHHGGRSQAVVNFLRQSGRVQVLNLQGGIDAWSREVDPGIARY